MLKISSDKNKNYMLFGLLLGDGSYQKSGKNGIVRISHTNKQRFYVKWLEYLCIINKLKYSTTYDYPVTTNYGDFIYSAIRIWVPDVRHFEKYNRFFKDNRKIPSKYVLNRINILGILLWYLDDGTLNISKEYTNDTLYKMHRFAYLNTQGFTKFENQQISKMLINRFKIQTRIHRDKKYFRLYMNATNFRKFYDLVEEYLPYILKRFHYKFNMKYKPNRNKNDKEYSKKYNSIITLAPNIDDMI